MYFLRIISLLVAISFAVNSVFAVEETFEPNLTDSNLLPHIPDENNRVNMNIKNDYHLQGKAIQYYIVDSLANAYSFYTNGQKPFVYNNETGILSMIKRGYSSDGTGTPGNPDNILDNLFIRESEDWGQSWDEPFIVYNRFNSGHGNARYPSVSSFVYDGELSYMFIAPVTTGEGWDGFIAGYNIIGGIQTYKVGKFNHNGLDYYWQGTSTKMVASTAGSGEPYSITISTPSPRIENRDGDNQSALGFIKPDPNLSEWNGYIPQQWDSDKFQVVTQDLKAQYPPGTANDYREFRYSSIVDLIEVDGAFVKGATGLFTAGNPTHRLTAGVSISEDQGETWSEYNICNFSIIQDYASSVGIQKLDSITTTYSMVFNAIDKNNYSFLSTLYENDYMKNEADRVRHIVELYYNNGAWGVRKVADISGYIIVYVSTDPTQAPRNQMGIELQLSKTADGEHYLAKFVDLFDYVNPDTGETIERGQHDVFAVVRKVNDSKWSQVINVTNTVEYDRITWIPDLVPNDLKNIPLLKTYTIPQSGTPNDNNWQRELEKDQYILLGHFDIDESVSVDEYLMEGDFNITQIFPNPANDFVNINFHLPQSGYVSIELYDLLGNSISEIYNGNLGMGIRSVNYNISDINSGIYYCTVTFNGKKISKPINIIK